MATSDEPITDTPTKVDRPASLASDLRMVASDLASACVRLAEILDRVEVLLP